MSARSRIGFRGAALEPHHAPPQRHRDRCAGLPTVRTYSRRDRRGSAEHQRVADFTARRAASGRSGPVRYHQLGPVLADYLWRYPRSWSTSRWMTASSIWSRKVSILPFGSENSRTRAWLCGALRRFGSCSAPLPTMSNNMACRESRPISYSLRAIPGEWRFKGPFPLQQRQYVSCRDARGRRYRLRSDFCCGPESCGRSLDLANARLSTG